jgi:hypothetical protein
MDASLAPGGLLVGQLVDEHQRPIPDAAVTVLSVGRPVAETRTDSHGAFAVKGLRGGVHQVAAAETLTTFRLWATGTAPPNAQESLRIVRGADAVRGQWGPPSFLGGVIEHTKVWATNPFIVGGVVATAIAVPVAIHNLDDDDWPSS